MLYLYTIYPVELGRVLLHMDTVQFSGFLTKVVGYDDDRNPIYFEMDKVCYLDDYIVDYGYCHIVSYTKFGVRTECDIYQSLS